MNTRKRRRVMAALPVGTGSASPAARSIHAAPRVDASDALEIAVVWLQRMARGLDARGQRALRAWLDAHEVHRKVLFEMAEIYDELNVLSGADGWPADGATPGETKPAEELI